MDDDSMDDAVGEDVETGIETDADIDNEDDGAALEPPTWRRPEPTGVASVDAAIGELAALDALPTSEHVAVYDGLHRQLQDALADLDGA